MKPRSPFLCYSLGAAGLAIALGGAAISNNSFWMDECISALAAGKPTLQAAWKVQGGPEAQLPLYMLYLWAYAQAFGTGEWTLRAAGLPWFVAGVIVFVRGFRGIVRSVLLCVGLAAFGAFAWYYLNEAKVYSTQFGCALALTGSGAGLLRSMAAGSPSPRWWQLFLLSFWLFCGTSILAMFWGFFFLAALLLMMPNTQRQSLLRLAPASMMVCVHGLAALAAYYAWTLTFAARPTAVGTTTPQTLLYIFYELLGFTGWGPGRNDLRSAGVSALKPHLFPIAVYAVVVGLVFSAGIKEALSRFGKKRVVLFGLVAVSPLVILAAYGMATRFRVLGRHATPLLPILLVVLALGSERLWNARHFLGKAITIAFLLLWFASSGIVRFAPRHEKDNYRAAAGAAAAAVAAGERVWWNSEAWSAIYYKVPVERILLVLNQHAEALWTLPPPDLVIVSKPDTHDVQGGVQTYLRERGYVPTQQVSVFTFWRKPK